MAKQNQAPKRRGPDNAKRLFCPHCGGKLVKFQSVQRCEVCDRAWFILQTSSGSGAAPEECEEC